MWMGRPAPVTHYWEETVNLRTYRAKTCPQTLAFTSLTLLASTAFVKSPALAWSGHHCHLNFIFLWRHRHFVPGFFLVLTRFSFAFFYQTSISTSCYSSDHNYYHHHHFLLNSCHNVCLIPLLILFFFLPISFYFSLHFFDLFIPSFSFVQLF